MRRLARVGAAPTTAPAGSPLTVLVMDDDPMVLETARMLLESGGHRVITARVLNELDSLVDCHQPDVVFIDLNFENELSLPALTRLRRRYSAEQLSVILSSGYCVDESTLERLDASQLRKPWVGVSLRSAIEERAKHRQVSSSLCAR
ncbi:MAG: response regulator [Myxococcota bacterium]